ncbi:MAG: hypothetical protein KF861_12290 [Planctomycetaceae bacterium]|nr:hypothetical protein [Planctomycetaceae bacterium]
MSVPGYAAAASLAAHLPAWWANFAFLAGLIGLVKHRGQLAFRCGIVATALAVSLPFQMLDALDLWLEGLQEFPFGSGYFLWVLSMVLLSATARWSGEVLRGAARR